MQIGDRLRLVIVERDPRCKMITLDPETAKEDDSILQHLKKTRGGLPGVYAAVLVDGVARRGDPVGLVQ